MDTYTLADRYDKRLAEELGFTEEELVMNKAGLISDRQRKMLAQIVRLRRTSRRLAIIVLLLSLGVLWAVGYSLMLEEEASLRVPGQFTIIYGSWIVVGAVLLAVFALFLWLDRRRSMDLREGKVSMAVGPARLFIKELRGAHLYGVKAHYVEVGQVKFQVADAKQYGAFEQGGKYRIFYVKSPPTQTILSVERPG